MPGRARKFFTDILNFSEKFYIYTDPGNCKYLCKMWIKSLRIVRRLCKIHVERNQINARPRQNAIKTLRGMRKRTAPDLTDRE